MTSIMDGKMGDAIMRYSNILLVAAAIAATACTKEIVSENGNNSQPEVKLYPMTFTAGADDGSASDTKVTLDDKSVLWSAGDQIKVFDDTETSLDAFEITSGEGTTSATFSGSVSDPSANTYYALYPYQESATQTISDITIGTTTYSRYLTVDLPETQTAVDGSVDPAAFIAVAVSDESGNFSFKNLNSLVKFQLSESDIENLASISISSNSLEAIAGSMNVAFNSSGIPVQTYVSGQMDYYVTLNAPDGGFKKETDYYIAIRSIGFSGGLTVTAKYLDGTCKHATSDNAPGTSLARNSVLNLGTLPLGDGLPNDLYIAYLHGQDIDAAGVKINKESYTKSSILTATSANTTIGSLTAGNVTFISQEDAASFQFSGNIAINGDVVLINRFQDKKVNIDANGKYFQANTGSLILSNITIDAKGSSTTENSVFIRNYKATDNLSKLIIDNCKISHVGQFFIQLTQSSLTVNDLRIHNSDIGFSSTEKSVYLVRCNQAVTFTKVDFYNNILFYENEGSVVGTLFSNTNGSTNPTISSLKIQNNTIVGLYPGKVAVTANNSETEYFHHYVMVNTFGSITQKANYFHLPDLYDFTGTNYYSIVYAKTNADVSYVDVSKGYVYYDSSLTTPTNINAFSTAYSNTDFNPSMNTTSLLNIDWTNETFVCSDSNFGAQRTQTGTETLSSRQAWSGASG
ncbi:MAG: hypothetical protein ACI4TM_03395, partial [Candidatus Cryptobacteroides sp.]